MSDEFRPNLTKLLQSVALTQFSYQEEIPGGKGETKLAFFLYSKSMYPGREATGLKFYSKHEMTDAVLAFTSAHVFNSQTSLVVWGGARGYRICTTMSASDKEEKRRTQEALEAMKELPAAGQQP